MVLFFLYSLALCSLVHAAQREHELQEIVIDSGVHETSDLLRQKPRVAAVKSEHRIIISQSLKLFLPKILWPIVIDYVRPQEEEVLTLQSKITAYSQFVRRERCFAALKAILGVSEFAFGLYCAKSDTSLPQDDDDQLKQVVYSVYGTSTALLCWNFYQFLRVCPADKPHNKDTFLNRMKSPWRYVSRLYSSVAINSTSLGLLIGMHGASRDSVGLLMAMSGIFGGIADVAGSGYNVAPFVDEKKAMEQRIRRLNAEIAQAEMRSGEVDGMYDSDDETSSEGEISGGYDSDDDSD